MSDSTAVLRQFLLTTFDDPEFVEQVLWGEPLDAEFTLAPMTVDLGIEDFAGADNGIAASLDVDVIVTGRHDSS